MSGLTSQLLPLHGQQEALDKDPATLIGMFEPRE